MRLGFFEDVDQDLALTNKFLLYALPNSVARLWNHRLGFDREVPNHIAKFGFLDDNESLATDRYPCRHIALELNEIDACSYPLTGGSGYQFGDGHSFHRFIEKFREDRSRVSCFENLVFFAQMSDDPGT